MITIGKIQYKENDGTARIETNIKTDGEPDILLFVEVEKKWGKYLVTDRADAFLVGILKNAMLTGHDIRCEDPVSAELLVMLERQLVHTLAKYDSNLYATKIYANLLDKPLDNAGAVGTGISLGLDSFTTIAENYAVKSSGLKLTHLLTFRNLFGGYYRKTNRDLCVERIYEKEKMVARELNLPLLAVNANLVKFVHPKLDYYAVYIIMMVVMCLGKLFRAYYISSLGLDFSYFNIRDTARQDCALYDLLTINCCSYQGGTRFLSGGGEKDRMEKLKTIAKFPAARKNLLSCISNYYNCMTCKKCKRNLLSLDALGLLDEFSEVYDIPYYRANRAEYIEWLCQQVQSQSFESKFFIPAYNLLRQREPELIAKYTYPLDKVFSRLNEARRLKNIYQEYARLYRELLTRQNWEENLRTWFQQRKIREVILYGNGSGTMFLAEIADRIGIKIPYVIGDLPEGRVLRNIPGLPEKTVDYPPCDAIIICIVDKLWEIERKLQDLVHVPIYKIGDVLELK